MSRSFDLLERDLPLPAGSLVPQLSDTAAVQPQAVRARAQGALSDGTLELVQRVFFRQADAAPRTVIFAGVEEGVGCSRICAEVAECLARIATRPVCLVEANFRTPALPELFQTTNHFGLTDALASGDPVRGFAKPVSTPNLWLLSAGALAGDSPNLLTSARLGARLAELRREFDYVLLDAPALTRYADAVTVGRLTDGLVLVLKAGSTRKEAAQTAISTLRTASVPVLGAVLNDRAYPIPERIYKRL